MQTEYAQEKATATQATEILEQETAKRMMLESELKEIQVIYLDNLLLVLMVASSVLLPLRYLTISKISAQ